MAKVVDWKNLNQKLLLIEDQYTKFKNLRVFCGTYNANGKSPDEFLNPWLCIDENIDIYAIGFQEVVDLTTTSLLLKTDWAEKEESWTNSVNDVLFDNKNFKSNPNYKLVSKIRMFGLYLLVYVSEKIQKHALSEVVSSYIATGILTVGNKGSVGISMKIYETRVCFVCSHFASDTDKLEKRNADFRSTRQYLKFQFDQDQNSNSYIDLDQHDIIFWFGDLNYRLDQVSLNDTLKLISTNNFTELIKYDQLSNERANNRVFEFYEEGEISFRPTYKYLVKSDIYEKQAMLQQEKNENNSTIDIDQVGKVKLPSWTDRVLYKSSNLKVKLLKYLCINMLTISDHKPVCALFEAQFKKIDQKEMDKLIQNLMKESDKKTNEEMPHISLDKFEFKFEDCTFYDRKSLIMTVNNKGLTRSNVDVIFYDAKKKDKIDENDNINRDPRSLHRKVSKAHELSQWINIFPQHKERVEAGSSFSIELTTSFNPGVLPRFNKERTVDDFLIVRCLNGNDAFATISCNYKPTIIGISLRALTTLNQSNESFENCDQKNVIDVIEVEIAEFENTLNMLFSLNLKNFSTLVQREKAAMHILNSNPNVSKDAHSQDRLSKISNASNISISNVTIKHMPSSPSSSSNTFLEAYKRSFEHLKEAIVDGDKYFNNELSSEYTYLMTYLIKRCNKNMLVSLDGDIYFKKSDSVQSLSNEANLTIEERKNLVLYYLTSKNFSDFEKSNFELELLAEILNDLLISLPQPLIPIRYLDFCQYTENCYEEASRLFQYLPKSHLMLFEMIVKFLQVYLKCLQSCDTNFRNTLANAIFQTSNNIITNNSAVSNKNEATNAFLKLFIDNHTSFRTF